MRQLKFRAWNRQDNEYITGDRVRVNGDGLLYIDRITVKDCFRPPHSRKNPWFIVEQFTGLKDKNGTEIYEGDIVIYGGLTYSVEYQSSRFMLCAPGRLSICLSELTYDCDTNQLNCEVIGNVHELDTKKEI
jgi:hypothetical protein